MNANSERQEKRKELLAAALERPASEREAFLAVACNGDARLRDELASLLADEGTVDDWLKQSALEQLVTHLRHNPQHDLTGTQLGRFQLRAQLGAGGMGEVWKAWDEKLEREVAIKLLPPEFAAELQGIARFQQEARLASTLNHSNIIRVYEDGQVTTPDGELYFIVTEFVAGQTLRDYLAQSDRNWRDAVRIATQIASALTAAHATNLIHRDIKPENIMVQADGQVRVLDFGIAKWSGGEGEKGRRGERETGRRGREACLISPSPPLPFSPSHASWRSNRHAALHVAGAGAGRNVGRAHRPLFVRAGVV